MSASFQEWLKTNKGRPVSNLTDDEILRYADEYSGDNSGFWGRSCSRLQTQNNVMREHINNAIDLCQGKIQSSNKREAFAIDVQQELRAAAATKEA